MSRCRIRTADSRRCVLGEDHEGEHLWSGADHIHYACDCLQRTLRAVDEAVDVAVEQLVAASKLPETFARHKRADDVLLELAVAVAGVRGPRLREAYGESGRWYV